MQYQPKTAKEIAEMSLRPEGEYPFEIANAIDGKSKTSGRDMITLDLSFFDKDGHRFRVKDYLVPGTAFGDRKIFEFCRSVGLGSKYATGNFSAEDCLGRSGFAKLSIEKGKAKVDGSGDFPDRNAVKYYFVPKGNAAPTAKPQPTEQQLANLEPANAASKPQDDIPF